MVTVPDGYVKFIMLMIAQLFPKLAFLTTGPLGWIVGLVVGKLAEKGVILVSTGVTNLTVNTEVKAWNEAYAKALDQVAGKKNLTKEEMEAIDGPVIKSVVDLLHFSKLRPSSDT